MNKEDIKITKKELSNLIDKHGSKNIVNCLLDTLDEDDFFTKNVLVKLSKYGRKQSVFLVGLNPCNDRDWLETRTFLLSQSDKEKLQNYIRIFDYKVIFPDLAN